MENNLYKRRIFDQIARYIPTGDIVVLHGARQVGKTSILRYILRYLNEHNKVAHYIDLEDSRLIRILDQGAEKFLKYLEEEGFTLATFNAKKRLYVLIDEIQYLADPSPFLKILADHHARIKLIVSGSSSFNIKSKFKDSLVGRSVNFTVYPLSFEEFLYFKKYHADLEKVFTEKKVNELVVLYEEYVRFGGYPKIVLTPDREMKETYLQQIIDTYIRKDIRDLAAIKDIHKFNKLLELLASQSGQLLNVAEASRTLGIAQQTLEHHLFLLEETYSIKLLRPFSRNMRSELTKTPKIFFYDSGLAHMLWLKEPPKTMLGQMFETSIFAELVKKYGSDKIFYWRTTNKKEIDFILRTGGRIVPIEAKINFAQFKSGAMEYFAKKYRNKRFSVAGLYGKKRDESFVYPWEL